ncbi:MAG: glutathione-disulfide reductase [Burkholderiaceae bacterium]|nr:glutathione-disulfide reductase [Sulfuritalea sp.]MCF8175775.1 glutathione-disulfide reductase [Burkholderiaceae bacterium]
MSTFDYQFFVVGGGSGGVRAARIAAGFGARVAIAENFRYGGTCVIRGCVPKKLLVHAAHFSADFADAEGFGWSVPPAQFSWPKLIAGKNDQISRLSGMYESNLDRSGVTVLHGSARLLDPHTVDLDGKRFSAEHILIATGGIPFLPSIPGIEHAITSNEVFDLAELPRRVLIVGGGYIAVEFAGIFRGLGAEVTMAYRGEQILRGFDDDLRQHLHDEMVANGIRIVLHSDVKGIERQQDGTLSVAVSGAAADTHNVDAVLYATGRVPNTEGLGLAEIGVTLDKKGGVVVDAMGRSTVANIFAVGDVTNRIALTPVAIREGAAVATSLFGPAPMAADLTTVPSAVFSQPPIGTVGMSETEALKHYAEIDIYRADFRSLRHSLTARRERTLIKLIVDAASQRVVGAHMIGADAAEIIQGVAIAIRMGATKADFDATVAIHPTSAEEFVTLKEKTTRKRHD